jgi:pimeloyl-ACP methyl ester carboxylesterase
VVPSADGTPISYEVRGEGEPALVFVHGWSCDARYWREQVPHFEKRHRVVTLDLAGHGHSGSGRSRYTMKAFGEDVRAVVEAAGSPSVVLVGHSMGGSVVAEAARTMPERVLGLVGVDTLENVEHPLSREDAEKMLAPLKGDFPAGTRHFVESMMGPDTEGPLRDWILADMAAAPPAVALSAMGEMLDQYVTGDAAKVFEAVRAPVFGVNGELWPVDREANRRHMVFYDAVVLEGADHFLMMNRPEEFNRALEKAVAVVLERSEKK